MSAPVSGRGAPSNALSPRFKVPQREADGDWLDTLEDIDGPAPRLRTTVQDLHPRSILSFNTSPDIPFDRSVNAFGGCEQLRGSCVKSQWRKWAGSGR